MHIATGVLVFVMVLVVSGLLRPVQIRQRAKLQFCRLPVTQGFGEKIFKIRTQPYHQIRRSQRLTIRYAHGPVVGIGIVREECFYFDR